MRERRRPAQIAVQSFGCGLLAILILQLFLRLPMDKLLALAFLWFSLKTIILFVLLRPDRSSGPATLMPTAREFGVISIANLVLVALTAGLMALLDRSLIAGTLAAAVLYSIGYMSLRKRLRWHPFAAG